MNIILNSVYSAVFKFTGGITDSIIISIKEQTYESCKMDRMGR